MAKKCICAYTLLSSSHDLSKKDELERQSIRHTVNQFRYPRRPRIKQLSLEELDQSDSSSASNFYLLNDIYGRYRQNLSYTIPRLSNWMI